MRLLQAVPMGDGSSVVRTHHCQASQRGRHAKSKAGAAQFVWASVFSQQCCSGLVWGLSHLMRLMSCCLSSQLPARHLQLADCWDLQFKLVMTGLCLPVAPTIPPTTPTAPCSSCVPHFCSWLSVKLVSPLTGLLPPTDKPSFRSSPPSTIPHHLLDTEACPPSPHNCPGSATAVS